MKETWRDFEDKYFTLAPYLPWHSLLLVVHTVEIGAGANLCPIATNDRSFTVLRQFQFHMTLARLVFELAIPSAL